VFGCGQLASIVEVAGVVNPGVDDDRDLARGQILFVGVKSIDDAGDKVGSDSQRAEALLRRRVSEQRRS
jgi:hypothetical protein